MNMKKLCLSIVNADTEEQVIKILENEGYWGDSTAWKDYGGRENNYSIIGAQQSKADRALVEKITNSVDAVLMRECLRKKINPEGEDAPESISDATQKFFGISEGKLSSLSAKQRTGLAENNIILISTGAKITPSYTIIDKGEGQTPNNILTTFLSLTESNKIRIPFVQGKFNMGGTGALRFCSTQHNISVILSKRDPQILKNDGDETEAYWGFTVIRREDPEKGMKSSTVRYLAPEGEILKFKADSLPLLPDKYPRAYMNPLGWGSVIKLYEYNIGPNLRGPAYLDLFKRLSLLIPNIGIPIRMYERRKGYSDPRGTEQITMAGMSVRLDDDKRGNLEQDFPDSLNFTIDGQKLSASLYAFKKEKGKSKKGTYSKNDGVVFVVNGQAHGFLPSTFFSRKSVRMDYLSDSILILLDCTDLDGRSREKLFMNSRDRLSYGEFRTMIVEQLEQWVSKHPGLKALRAKRRHEEIEGKIGDSKPLLETISQIIKKSPTLSTLFIQGVKLSNPFDLRDTGTQEEFKGKDFPTYFKLIEERTSKKPKIAHTNKRFRIEYETDAVNNYFERERPQKGKFSIWCNEEVVTNFSINLWNGIATLNVTLPEGVNVGDLLLFETEVEDISRSMPLSNEFYVKVEKDQKNGNGTKSASKKPSDDKKGKDRSKPSQLDLPNMREVRKPEWEEYGFTKEDALTVKYGGDEVGYDFWINMDNINLQTEIKGRPKVEPKLLESQYKFGMVLIGLSLILKEFENGKKTKDEETEDEESSDNGGDQYKRISGVCRAISPFLLPMISSLGELEITD